MSWTSFNEEHELFRKIVREFARKEIASRIREFEKRGEYPWELQRKIGQMGLIGLPLPKEYGGQGADAVTVGVANTNRYHRVAVLGWRADSPFR